MALNHRETEPDNELVLRTLSGESQAFGRLVEKYQGLVYGLAYNKVGNTTDAQDIAQEVFVRAFRKLSQLDDHECFGAWIKAITANECRTWLRNQRPTVSLDEAEYSPAHGAAAHSIWRYDEFRTEVAQAIQALPERNRQIITLYYLSGMTCEEIADSLDMTPPAVQSRLHRARQLLREQFSDEIERTLGGSRLPRTFSQDVLSRVSVYPVKDGCMQSARSVDGELITLFMGVPQEGSEQVKLLGLTMRTVDAYGYEAARSRADADRPMVESLDAQLRAYRDLDMELAEVILHLDDRAYCMARAVFRKGRTRHAEVLKPSQALALAHRIGAPILADESVIQARQVGEDGIMLDLGYDLDAQLGYLREAQRICDLHDRIYKLGIDTGKGRDTARVRKDFERRVLWASIDGLEGASISFEFGPYPSWIDYWERPAICRTNRHIQDDGALYDVTHEIQGEEIVFRWAKLKSDCTMLEFGRGQE